jgi:hypothetical protein
MPPGKYTVTLLEFVKRECANWQRGDCLFGECSVAAGKRCRVPACAKRSAAGRSRAVLTGGDPRAPDLPAPRLRQAGLPAPSGARQAGRDYFGACVAPLAKTRTEYLAAADEYARICGTKAVARRLCECGALLPARVRMCAKCITAKRRRTCRDAQTDGPGCNSTVNAQARARLGRGDDKTGAKAPKNEEFRVGGVGIAVESGFHRGASSPACAKRSAAGR